MSPINLQRIDLYVSALNRINSEAIIGIFSLFSLLVVYKSVPAV